MTHLYPWLIAIAAAVVLIPLVMWLGVTSGRSATRKYPSAAAALWILSTFLKIDPPPPPKAERVTRSEDEKGAPPKT